MGVGGIEGGTAALASPSNNSDTQTAVNLRRAATGHIVPKTAQDPNADNERQRDIKYQDLQDAVTQTQQFVNIAMTDIQFVIDNRFDAMVVKVVDSKTKEVIRQIPSEEMLSMAKALEKLQGLLVRQKA